MNDRNNVSVDPIPPEAMFKAALILTDDATLDRSTSAWAARMVDIELKQPGRIRRWVEYLESARKIGECPFVERPDSRTRISDAVRNIYRWGAEKSIYLRLVSPSELYDLVLNTQGLRLLSDLKLCTDKTVLNDVESAIEATQYLVTAPTDGPSHRVPQATNLLSGHDSTATRLAGSELAQDHDELHHRVAAALFPILEELGIEISADRQAEKATMLLRELLGQGAQSRYFRLVHVLQRLRGESEVRCAEVVAKLCPELLEQSEAGKFNFDLSFRLFLRDRLKEVCIQEGWRPTHRFDDLESAIASLSRERIGELISKSLQIIANLQDKFHDELARRDMQRSTLRAAWELINFAVLQDTAGSHAFNYPHPTSHGGESGDVSTFSASRPSRDSSKSAEIAASYASYIAHDTQFHNTTMATGLSRSVRIRRIENSKEWMLFKERYGPVIFGYLRKLSLSESDADYLTQNVLDKILKEIDESNYRTRESFHEWLFEVTHSAFQEYLSPSSSHAGTFKWLTSMWERMRIFTELEHRDSSCDASNSASTLPTLDQELAIWREECRTQLPLSLIRATSEVFS